MPCSRIIRCAIASGWSWPMVCGDGDMNCAIDGLVMTHRQSKNAAKRRGG
jgi:hypothetical protein